MDRVGQKRSGTAAVAGAELYYEVRGCGPAVLFIAGATGDAGHFEQAADILASRNVTAPMDWRLGSKNKARRDDGVCIRRQSTTRLAANQRADRVARPVLSSLPVFELPQATWRQSSRRWLRRRSPVYSKSSCTHSTETFSPSDEKAGAAVLVGGKRHGNGKHQRRSDLL
jgi:hypothetical protein